MPAATRPSRMSTRWLSCAMPGTSLTARRTRLIRSRGTPLRSKLVLDQLGAQPREIGDRLRAGRVQVLGEGDSRLGPLVRLRPRRPR